MVKLDLVEFKSGKFITTLYFKQNTTIGRIKEVIEKCSKNLNTECVLKKRG